MVTSTRTMFYGISNGVRPKTKRAKTGPKDAQHFGRLNAEKPPAGGVLTGEGLTRPEAR
jgi:hypothetical protein